LASKVIAALKTNIEEKKHFEAKLEIARKVNHFAITRYAFNYLKAALREIKVYELKT